MARETTCEKRLRYMKAPAISEEHWKRKSPTADFEKMLRNDL